MSTPFAVFLVARTKGGYAATTRAADRGETGRIGLPGGKVDDGEIAIDALRRESAEEGWLLSSDAVLRLIHEQDVEGRPVAWYELARGRVRDGMTNGELEALINKRPEKYSRFKGFRGKLKKEAS